VRCEACGGSGYLPVLRFDDARRTWAVVRRSPCPICDGSAADVDITSDEDLDKYFDGIRAMGRAMVEAAARGMYESEHTKPNDVPWGDLPEIHRHAFEHQAAAALAAIEASGWVLVPTEPTTAMRSAGAKANHPLHSIDITDEVYRVMLSARPRDAAD
jgi:hypothetical protein